MIAKKPVIALLALTCGLCTGSTLWLTSQTSPDLPKFDEWQVFVPALTGAEPITAEWMWRQLNEHRILLPRLVYLSGFMLTQDFRVGAFLNVAILSLVAIAAITTAIRKRGHARAADAFFPLILLHWGQTHLYLLSVTLNFTMTIAFAYLAVFAALVPERANRLRTGVVVGLCALGMVLSSLIGVLMALPLAAWVVAQAWFRFRGDAALRREGWLLIGLAGLVLAAVALYFVGFQRPGSARGTGVLGRGLGEPITTLLVVLAMSLGWLGRAIGVVAGLAIGILVVVTGGMLIRGLWRSPQQPGPAALLALLLGPMLVLLAISFGRGQISGEALWATTRYAMLSIPLLVVVYLASLDAGRPGVWLQRALAVVALAVFVGPLIPAVHYPYAQDVMRAVSSDEQALIRGLREGQTSEQAAREFFPHQNNYDPRDGARWIDMLRGQHMGPFATSR